VTKGKCERCGVAGEMITEGPFKGSRHELDYCAKCSKDLCESCLKNGYCRESLDHKHYREVECESCLGSGSQEALNGTNEQVKSIRRKCLDCGGDGVVIVPVAGVK
jgi:DnaJ-class molecular chaperone